LKIVGKNQRESETLSQDNKVGSSIPPKSTTGMANFVQTAFNLACFAKLVVEITLIVVQMAKEFSHMSPRLLNGAFSFFKFTKSLKPFLNEKMDNLKSLVALEEENWRLRNVDEENRKLKDQFGMST